MKLSKLQKYILKTSSQNNKILVSRNIFENFYDNLKKPPAKKIRANIITKSLERLIEKGLMVGFGERTQHRWFIKQVQLTKAGKKASLKLFGKQEKFPFKFKK